MPFPRNNYYEWGDKLNKYYLDKYGNWRYINDDMIQRNSHQEYVPKIKKKRPKVYKAGDFVIPKEDIFQLLRMTMNKRYKIVSYTKNKVEIKNNVFNIHQSISRLDEDWKKLKFISKKDFISKIKIGDYFKCDKNLYSENNLVFFLEDYYYEVIHKPKMKNNNLLVTLVDQRAKKHCIVFCDSDWCEHFQHITKRQFNILNKRTTINGVIKEIKVMNKSSLLPFNQIGNRILEI